MQAKGVVVAKIVGGLGNQMFQYACGRALALRSNADLLLDVSAFSRYQLHRYGLEAFKLDAPKAPWSLSSGGRAWVLLRKLGFNNQKYLQARDFTVLQEPGDLSFRPDVLNTVSKAYTDGYWQSERYFADAADQIRSDFQLRGAMPSLPVGLSADGVTNVSLHVRRGDYVSNALANATHGLLDDSYYQNAIRLIEEKHGSQFRLIIFSDDPEWVRENMKFKQSMHFIQGSTVTPHEDMHLMSMCDHHIIANSSFSWWGAWLNPSPSKIVVAPRSWFRTQRYVAADIYPESWHKV